MPKDAKHLKQHRFKKGVSGNPLGGKIHNPEIRKLKSLTEAEMIEIGSLVLKGSVDELRAIARDGSATALKAMMASVAARTISKGDPYALDVLLNRLVGKTKENVSIDLKGKVNSTVTHVDRLEVVALIKEVEDEC